MVKEIRINKYLAQCNVGSRREAEKYILAGEVKVNGKIITQLSYAVKVDEDEVCYKDKVIKPDTENVYIMLNKPKKYLVSTKDDFGRKTVYDLLPDLQTNLFYIGRLDYMTEGLLLLTNDGDFADKVIHPKYKLPKVYKVVAQGKIDEMQVEKLRSGVVFDGRKTSPAKVFIKHRTENKTTLKLTIYEGRKRQVRRMLKAVGSEVLELKRLQIGHLNLGKLPIGMWRYLTRNELRKLTI